MKRQEWNEDQIEQLLKQLPSVKDKQTAEDIYQNIQNKPQHKKKHRTWIGPSIASVAALLVFALISPYLFQNFSTNEQSTMDKSISTEESSQLEQFSVSENDKVETNVAQESNMEQTTIDKKQLLTEEKETFVTSASEAEGTITVGFTDGKAQNILPISIETNEKEEKLEQIEEINPEIYMDELGPITFELSSTEFEENQNREEIHIEYNGEPDLSTSTHDMLYQNAIIETFRWLNYKKAKLFTKDKEGIEFGNSGLLIDMEVKKENKKAYFLYQFNEQTLKLLVPSPDPYVTIDNAIEAMKQGIEERDLKPTILNNINSIRTKENGSQLEIEFDQYTDINDNEPTIIMLESILLTAKEFGYKTVQFKDMQVEKIGIMDVTKPIEVPFSPNPIE